MSIKASEWAWDIQGLRPGTKLVLLALADHANETGGSCYPSLTRLALKSIKNRTSLIKAIEELERFRSQLDDAYGPAAEDFVSMQVGKGGKLADIIAFSRG